MGTGGRVSLRDIFDMLKHCAPGYERKDSDHKIRVTWQGQVFPSLPKGEHGKGDRAEIQRGIVKQMVKFFGIADCAKAHIESLR